MNATYYKVPGSCGTGVLASHGFGSRLTPTELMTFRSAGLTCSGFVNEPRCKVLYDEMKENFEIVYQSKVTVNKNSLRKYFFVVWDTSKKLKKDKK